jgi:hypothetical protein
MWRDVMSEDLYTDREYNLILMRLERWLDELSAKGPEHVSEVYKQMARIIDNDREPCIDFNHQKNYR